MTAARRVYMFAIGNDILRCRRVAARFAEVDSRSWCDRVPTQYGVSGTEWAFVENEAERK